MNSLNLGEDFYLKGRIGWKGLSKDEYLYKSDYRIINATSLEDKFINWNICGYISEERYAESPEIQLEENDLLISKDGTLGKIGYVKNLNIPSTVASGVFVLRNICKDRVNTDYLYHLLKSNIFKDFITKRKASGSTIHHLYQRDLSQFEIELPNLLEQEKVANVLNVIDSKIEINNKINIELEFMAKTLYDFWFIQFDFPDENGKPYKSSGGKMVYNKELKIEIPKDWDDSILSDIEENIITGKTPPRENIEYFNGNIPFITIGDIRGNMHIVNTKETLTLYGADYQSSKYINKGAICVSCIASPGLVGFATELSQTNQQINSIECKKEENQFYLYFALQRYFQNAKAKTGNTFPNMNKGDFSNIKLLKPNKNVLSKFKQTVKSSIDKIFLNSKENQKLSELRDWLLPMLMNGQVRVKNNDYKDSQNDLLVAQPKPEYN